MATKVSLDEVPRALRIESQLKFITGVLEEWKNGRGLQGNGLAVNLQKDAVDECVAEIRAFHGHYFPRPNVATLSERAHEERAS